MPHSMVEGGLDILEKGDANTTDLIAHASRILGINVDQDISDAQSSKQSRNHAPNFAFREQWVLKWLLRKFDGEVIRISVASENQLDTFLKHPEPWRLLLYLLQTIPDSALLEILLGRKFLSCLDKSIQIFLNSDSSSDQLANGQVTDSVVPLSKAATNDGERVTKKRRIVQQTSVEQLGGPSWLSALSLALQACQRLGRLLKAESISKGGHHQNRTASWALLIDDCASLFGNSLYLTTRLATNGAGAEDQPQPFQRIDDLIPLWASRSKQSGSPNGLEDTKAFNRHCLEPTIQILHAIRSGTTREQQERRSVESLQKLVALHTILPLRDKFNQKHLQQWKMQQPRLMWPGIYTVYKDMLDNLCPDRPSRDAGALAVFSPAWASHCCVIFETAVRLIRKSDLRRQQSEQAWLDTLLMVLVYIACPRMPKLNLSRDKSINLLDPVYPAGLNDSAKGLESLIATAIEHNVKLSIQAISYVAAAVGAWKELTMPWKLISGLVRVNDGAFIDDATIPTTSYAMNNLVDRIQHSTIDNLHYDILKDGILLPLFRNFASSRSLRTFLNVWKENLLEALRIHTETENQSGEIPAIFVWLDQDLFAEASIQLKQHATQNLFQDYLQNALTGLQELPTRVGSTLNTFAHLAICEAMIGASNDAGLPLSQIQRSEMQEKITAALKSRSDYRKQRWRLWSLLTALYETSTVDRPSDVHFIAEEPGLHQLSVNATSARDMTDAFKLKEVLERFHFLAVGAELKIPSCITAFTREVYSLQILVSALLSGANDDPHSRSEQPSAGGFPELTPYGLACTCLGILNQHPRLYELCPLFLPTLLKSLIAKESTLSKANNRHQDIVTIPQLLWTAIENDQFTADTAHRMMKDAIREVNSVGSSFNGIHMLMTNLSLDTTSKADREVLSHATLDYLEKDLSTMAEDQLVIPFILLDCLAAYVPRLFAESWVRLFGISKSLTELSIRHSSESLLVIAQCLSNILRLIWKYSAEHSKDNSIRTEILEWCKQSPQNDGFLDQIWTLVVRRTIVDLASADHKSSTSGQLTPVELQEVTKQMHRTILQDLTRLGATQLRIQHLFPLTVLLESLNDLKGLEDFVGNYPDLRTKLYSQVQGLESGLDVDGDEMKSPDSPTSSVNVCHTLRLLLSYMPITSLLETPSSALDSCKPGLMIGSHRRTINLLIAEADACVRSTPFSTHAELLKKLLASLKQARATEFELLVTVSILLRGDRAHLEMDRDASACITDLASLKHLTDASEIPSLIFQLSCSKLALDLFANLVNQSTIDVLLQNICTLLSASAKGNVDEINSSLYSPEWIYIKVCTILESLLSRYRRRMSDRHHLVLPVLQQLLKCHFFPGKRNLKTPKAPVSGSDPIALLRSLPWWLRNSERPLPASSVEKLSRILTSICNPTVSAAKSSLKQKGSTLNDETKLVKTMAGQHLQYLVTTYCRATLDGEIASDSKDKLMPGMYAILDSLSRDLMKAMNSAMDPSSRAIFKVLYDDWTRYGKWDKT